ncbi:linear amide C-N hydrolase [Vibrio profundi]|uniref:linear amide C-N hydrolase n=1 Tax=Vibrio profundi TaxID=1774960 RepID=UPI00373555FB
MCTRIFNSLNINTPMTGRNFDWHNPLTTYLYHQPASKALRIGFDLPSDSNEEAITWNATYASICTYLVDDAKTSLATTNGNQNFATIDGINEKGLVVNGLEDLLAHFEDASRLLTESDSTPKDVIDIIKTDMQAFNDTLKAPEGSSLLSSNRWVQFVLDKFDSVRSAADYFRSNPDNLFIKSGEVPDGKNDGHKVKLHLTLSDSSGNSAIIELRCGKFIVNESPDYHVATVTPRFEVQQLLLQPWLKKWQDPQHFAGLSVYDVPGGTATHQRFARANYFYLFAKPKSDTDEVLAQTRSLMASCATPLGVHLERHPSEDAIPSANTLWTSVNDHRNLCYHFINANTLGHQWLEFDTNTSTTQRVKLIDANSDDSSQTTTPVPNYGELSQHLEPCSMNLWSS